MKKKDYMPEKDGDFDILQNNVYSAATADAAKWLIPQGLLTALNVPQLRWISAYANCCNPATRTPAVTREKNDGSVSFHESKLCEVIIKTIN
ncbi:MAG: hypothetical protein LBP50_09410 [Tannerella sp.]|nr:hypothetical protein [Tannerella sp.]